MELLLFILFIFAMIVAHELGHYIVLRYYTDKPIEIELWPNIVIGKWNINYLLLSNGEYILVLISGIITGLIPIVIASYYIERYIIHLIILYFIGCNSDIRNIIKVFKNENNS